MWKDLSRILFVDDDPDLRMLLRLSLNSAGYTDLQEGESGEEVVGLARSFQPDLILLDHNMPGVSGEDALALLQQDSATLSIPVIIVTGRDREEFPIGNSGVIGVIQKPFSPASLGKEIQSIWERKP